MLEKYDPNICFGRHTIRITLMHWDYVGHVAVEVNGNCKGAILLDPCYIVEADEDDIQHFVENDCNFSKESGIFSAKLKNQKGEILEIEDFVDEIENLIVGIEIVDYVQKEW